MSQDLQSSVIKSECADTTCFTDSCMQSQIIIYNAAISMPNSTDGIRTYFGQFENPKWGGITNIRLMSE